MILHKNIHQLWWKAQMKLDLTKKQEMMMLMLCLDVWAPLEFPTKKKKRVLCCVSLSLRYIGRIVLLLDQINIIKSWILCYNLQGDKEQKSTYILFLDKWRWSNNFFLTNKNCFFRKMLNQLFADISDSLSLEKT